MNKESNFKYFIDETKRTVTAVLTTPDTSIMQELVCVVNKGTGSIVNVDNMSFHPSMLIKGTYTGKAVCHPNDTFDVETGKKLAKARAIEHYLKDRRRVVNRLDLMFNEIAHRVNDMKTYTDRSMDRIGERINSFE